MVVALLSLLLAGAVTARNEENCLPGTWLPEGADWTSSVMPGVPYDRAARYRIVQPSMARSIPPPSSTCTNTVRIWAGGLTSPQIVASSGSVAPRVRV